MATAAPETRVANKPIYQAYRILHVGFTVLPIIIIDVQESFRHRGYWRNSDIPCFVERLAP